MGLNGGWMTICALVITLQTTIIVIMVALTASNVHEEVKKNIYFGLSQPLNYIITFSIEYFISPIVLLGATILSKCIVQFSLACTAQFTYRY